MGLIFGTEVLKMGHFWHFFLVSRREKAEAGTAHPKVGFQRTEGTPEKTDQESLSRWDPQQPSNECLFAKGGERGAGSL